MKKYFVAVIIFVIAAAAVYFIFMVSLPNPFVKTTKEFSGVARCESEARTAETAAENLICTQIIAEMFCSHDRSFIFSARNGCIISALENQGWTFE